MKSTLTHLNYFGRTRLSGLKPPFSQTVFGPNSKLCKRGTEKWQKYREVFPEPAKQPLVAPTVQQPPPQVIHVHAPATQNNGGKSDMAALLIAFFFGPFGLIYKGNGTAALVWFIVLFLGLIFTAGAIWLILWPIMLIHTACAKPPQPTMRPPGTTASRATSRQF